MQRTGSLWIICLSIPLALILASINLYIAAERKVLAQLEARVIHGKKEIHLLEAELRTRARLPLMELWNKTSLTLISPEAVQFLEEPWQLAAYAETGQPETPTAIQAVARASAEGSAINRQQHLIIAYEQDAAPTAHAARARGQGTPLRLAAGHPAPRSPQQGQTIVASSGKLNDFLHDIERTLEREMKRTRATP